MRKVLHYTVIAVAAVCAGFIVWTYSEQHRKFKEHLDAEASQHKDTE